MTLKTKLTTAIATGAVLLNALAPAAFATTITVTGNGDSSYNNVDVSNNNSTDVTQSNHSNVTNNVSSTASTGGNSADRNTGGNSSVDTGDATSKVSVTTAANTNSADVANCNCNGGDTTVTVSGNGTDSNNQVDLSNGRYGDKTNVDQHNYSTVNNQVTSNAQTGGNSANRNTGGSAAVTTGNAKSDVTVSTSTNVNAAQVGSSNAGAGTGNGVNVVMAGNGDSSRNSIDLDTHNSVELRQDNDSYIKNFVQSNAKTGGNEADRNTGGNTSVDTGDATSKVTVTNEPNFNAANVDDCGCTTDLTLKVAGNGVDSNNKIDADAGNDLTVGNYNGSYIDNELTPSAKTGWNEADRNTGPAGIDPVTNTTGNAYSDTTVTNSGNSNSFGEPFDLPSMGNVNFTTDFSAFWAAWMGWFSNQG